MRSLRFDAIGTRWRIEYDSGRNLEQAILEVIDRFDHEFSRFRRDSWVHKVSQAPGSYPLSADGRALLGFYRRLYDVTGGRVTPLIGSAMEDAGYDAVYSLRPRAIRPIPAWDDALVLTDDRLVTSRPVLLDVGAAGKGYLVDTVGALLVNNGISEYVIDAGGDIRHSGERPVVVGLENPHDATEAVGTVRLHTASICGSSGSRRAWNRFTHIIDPVRLASPVTVAATWVRAADTMTADGLATALFFCGPQTLRPAFDFDYALLDSDGRLCQSRGFGAEIFTQAAL